MAEFTIGNWIPACQSLRAHTKRKRLSRRLDIGLHETVGLLFCLWWWALDEAEDGDLSGFSDQDIADGADWGGDAAALVAALTEAGFLSQDRQLVNWTKFVGRLLAQRDARREAERLRQQRYRQSIRDRLNGHAPVTPVSRVTGDVVTGDSPSGHAPLRPDHGVTNAHVTRDFALNSTVQDSTVQDRREERGSFASPVKGAVAPDADDQADRLLDEYERTVLPTMARIGDGTFTVELDGSAD